MDPLSSEHAAARSQIIEVLHRYAYLAKDHANWDAMVPLFTTDGVFLTPMGPVPSTEISRITMGQEPEYIRHHITTIDIEFIDETHARTDSYYIVYSDRAQPDHWGSWVDEFRCEDGRWLLTLKNPGGGKGGFSPDGYLALSLADAGADADWGNAENSTDARYADR